MYIESIFSFINSIKNQGQNKYFTPEEVSNAFNRASTQFFTDNLPLFSKDQLITDYFKNFIKDSEELTLTGTNVKACDIPSDYAYCTDLVVKDSTSEAPVYLLNDSEWNERKRSASLPPEAEYPIARVKNNKLEILPISYTTAVISYIRYPVDVVYGYNMSVDGRAYIFNEAGSTDTDWPKVAHDKIIAKTCKILGVSLHDTWLVQYEGLLKQSEA